ncbi:MAG: M17 family peptidase N-terminal domain-containing protein [Syntrophales bacterium]|nr:M17 family peptidase N-terminal domain-containing protein [Syntrophales bacterium]
MSATSVHDLRQEGLALALFSDEKPPRGYAGMVDWRLNGLISKSMAQGRVSGSVGEEVLLYPDRSALSPWKILLLGLGELEKLNRERIHQAGRAIINTMRGIGCHDFSVSIPGTGRCDLPVASLVEALLLGMVDSLSVTNEPEDLWPSVHFIEIPQYLEDVKQSLREAAARSDQRVTVEDAPDE